MPYIQVDTEMDLSVEEFYDSCSKRELNQLIELLREDELVTISFPHNGRTYMDDEWISAIEKLYHNRLRLDSEDTDLIIKISNKL